MPYNLIKVADARLSAAGLRVLKHFEQGPKGGFASVRYQCSAHRWTLGYGHVLLSVDRFVEPITEALAETILANDAARFEREVKALLKLLGVAELEQGQYDALVCMAFNTGVGIRDGRKGDLADSTLIQYVAQGRMHLAADEFLKWVYGGGKVLPGLVRRRKCERFLFLTGKADFFERA